MIESHNIDKPAYWDSRYRSDEADWDMGTPTPAFEDLLDSKKLEPGTALVLGCGKGYDALLFAQRGFDVTAIDFSSEAIVHARVLAEQNGVKINFVQEDLFDYSLDVMDEFNYVIEYVTYCAIDPARRAEFASMAASVLKPGGQLVGLFFPLDNHSGGPPFAVSMDEVHRLFGRKLELVSVEAPPRSVTPRKGRELMTIWKKK
ncbi:MAG: methyltransferase domain-containing protein [Ignavibacteriae bacterium]|nr:methyltransferase domain-containing protein [Ignavibacteriota bacterium]